MPTVRSLGAMTDPVLAVVELGSQWPTLDPFLFCAHHDDAYPAGDERMAPAVPLGERDMGQDFSGRDGFSMYHGLVVPGFPNHPHRGFETVTFVRKGFIDHADSLGAVARFGRGDVQWVTAGGGIVHSEMFPLLHQDAPNHLELFQIWLNLPAADKLVPAYFTMFWDEDIPRVEAVDAAGRTTTVTVIAGRLGDAPPHDPPPDSWASHPEADIAIWHLHLEPGATWTLPPAAGGRRDPPGALRVRGRRPRGWPGPTWPTTMPPSSPAVRRSSWWPAGNRSRRSCSRAGRSPSPSPATGRSS